MNEKNIMLETQLKNAEILLKGFYSNCELASMKNDFMIDNCEKEILKKIDAMNEIYLKGINKILNKYFT